MAIGKKRKNKRKHWNKEKMIEAVKAVRNRECGYKKASKNYEVPRGTLERYVKSDKTPEECVCVSMGRKSVLGDVLENELVKYCLLMDQKYYGLRKGDLRSMAFQIAERNGIASSFDQETRSAGLKWMRSFLKRHPELSIRCPQGLSKARMEGFNSVTVNAFFDLYEKEYANFVTSPHRIYNVDETGVTVVPHGRQAVISQKGKSNVSVFSPAERGKLITIVMCMGSVGNYVPPMFIWPRINDKVELMDGAPWGSISACTKSGWISPEAFIKWMNHFIEFTKPTKEDPVPLILDGHYTHTRNVELIEIARQNYVTIVVLPPHCTHRLQPLDVGFMKSFKTCMSQELESWNRNHVGRCVNEYVFAPIFAAAYERAATMQNSTNAFRRSGLVPCDRNIFQDHHFQVEVLNENQDAEQVDEPDAVVQQVEFSPNDQQPTEVVMEEIVESPEVMIGPSTSGTGSSNITPTDDHARLQSYVFPSDFSPVPQLTTTISKRAGKAAVITSSPFKNVLKLQKEAKDIRKELAELKKQRRAAKAALKQAQSANRNMKQGPASNKSTKKAQIIATATDPPASSATTSKGRNVATKSAPKSKPNTAKKPVKKSASESEGCESDDWETECLFCGTCYANDKSGEEWVQCQKCRRWAHELCGAEELDFVCSLCKKRSKNGRNNF